MSAKNTVDKIRPILEAMERSIESARRQRLNEDGADAPDAQADRQVGGPSTVADSSAFRPDESNDDDRDPKRMKARPKRANPLI